MRAVSSVLTFEAITDDFSKVVSSVHGVLQLVWCVFQSKSKKFVKGVVCCFLPQKSHDVWLWSVKQAERQQSLSSCLGLRPLRAEHKCCP